MFGLGTPLQSSLPPSGWRKSYTLLWCHGFPSAEITQFKCTTTDVQLFLMNVRDSANVLIARVGSPFTTAQIAFPQKDT